MNAWRERSGEQYRISCDLDFFLKQGVEDIDGINSLQSILFVAATVLAVPGCASTRTENQSTKTVRDRISTAVGESAVFASENRADGCSLARFWSSRESKGSQMVSAPTP